MKYTLTLDFIQDTFSIEGELKTFINNNNIIFLDGWVTKNLKEIDPLLSQNYAGVYNLISWNSQEKKVKVKNDALGQRPLYLFLESSKAIISDNFWDIVLKTKNIVLFEHILEQMKDFRRIAPTWITPIKGLYKLPSGSIITYSPEWDEPEINHVDILRQSPDYSITVEKAADQLYDCIIEQFRLLPKLFANREIWFGNSGGMDSRLIPAFAKLIGINVQGFIVSSKHGLIKNRSIRAADQIAKKYRFNFVKLPYDLGDSWKRLMRDLYVSPFGPANFHKNPNYELFKDKLVLNGGNSFTIANDNNFWRSDRVQSNPMKEMVIKYFARSSAKTEEIKFFIERMGQQVEQAIPGADPFSKLRTIHQILLNQTSPAGGFESMSLSGEFQYIYHPFALKKTIYWPEQIFYNRKVQSMLLKKYFPDLLEIPDQNGNYWKINNDNILQKIIRKAENKIVSNGLDYDNWAKSAWFSQLRKKASGFVQESKIDEAINTINKIDYHNRPQDKFDMLKLAVLIVILKTGKYNFYHIQ